jgi:hypothetical protein
MELELSQLIFKKFKNINFKLNLSSWNPVVPSGQAEMIKLIFAFQNFVNTSKTNMSEQIAEGRYGP